MCNAAVCTTTDSISIEVCEESEEERDQIIETVLSTVRIFSYIFSFSVFLSHSFLSFYFLGGRYHSRR